VNHVQPITNKSPIGLQILAYLAEHPEAQDTVDGIVEWWLLERQITYQIIRVKEALSELVAKGWILENKAMDSQVHYRVNQNRYEEVRELFKQKDG
jgi:hypothetical protein